MRLCGVRRCIVFSWLEAAYHWLVARSLAQQSTNAVLAETSTIHLCTLFVFSNRKKKGSSQAMLPSSLSDGVTAGVRGEGNWHSPGKGKKALRRKERRGWRGRKEQGADYVRV